MKEDELEILEEFVQESREHLSAIEPDLLEMERLGSSTAQDIVNRVFRAIHSTKGGAAFLAFESLKDFSHVMENVLMLIRDKKLEIAPNVIDALLRGVDVLRKMVDDVRTSDSVDCARERAALEALLVAPKAPAVVSAPSVEAVAAPTQATSPSTVATVAPVASRAEAPAAARGPSTRGRSGATNEESGVEDIRARVREAVAHGKRIYRIDVSEELDLQPKKQSIEQLEATCAAVGEVLQRRSERKGGSSGTSLAQHRIVLATVLDRTLVTSTLGLIDSRIEPLERATVLSSDALTDALERAKAFESKATKEGIETQATERVVDGANRRPAVPEGESAQSGSSLQPRAPVQARANQDATGSPATDARIAGATSEKPNIAAALAKVAQGPGAVSAGKDGVSEAAETLRVRVELLNQLMDSASELVLGRNQLLRALKEQADKSAGLGIILQHIDRVTTDLQEGIMQTRMQQIGSLFGRFARVARDLGRQLGKNVELRSEGNHVELDKSIIEALVDPLTHIVRNAVDHAIETPEERRKRKKPEVGRILLSASHESGQVKIIVEDDGRGIDRAKVLRKAIEKGIIAAATAEKMTERDVVGLLMMPGFSTADQISDVSGRGVGMDVVRTNVESLGGQIEIESELGFGTSVQLRLPLTLAIIPSLIVGANHARFAVPQASIVELVWVRADDERERIQSLHGALTLRLRERLLPLVKVEDVLGGKKAAAESSSIRDGGDVERRDRYILVLRTGTEHYGLIVDELFESEEIVVKPLPHFLKGIDCFAGTTILGDGTVTMILDPSGVASRAGLRFASTSAAEAVVAEGTRRSAATKRSVILFAGSPEDQYLVPQEQVLRLERVSKADLRRSGGRDYVCYRGVGLPLVRLESFLPVTGVPDIAEEVYLLIPRMEPGRAVEPTAGILVWRILDAMDLELSLQNALFEGPGVKGATLVDGVLTTMLDPVQLVVFAHPRSERAA
ncbi:MAG: chemotaxis protein CheA [Polyangiaceae bacterium]